MEITGKIIAVLPAKKGVSARTGSEWVVQNYVVETMEQFPRKVCFEVFGADRIQQMNIQMGETLVVSFDVDAHEYNGNWYNRIRAWKVDRNVQAAAAPAAPAAPAASSANASAPFLNTPLGTAPFPPQPAAAPAPLEDDNSDMPF
ncbi:MAG: DUF3127 domain-containing protein [Bacteroidales bacterium]|nr:DUF3127 domain-containing protein [Candidatus Physcousia equi]